MPYFDDKTYLITELMRGWKTTRRCAEEFYETCQTSGSYHAQILDAEAQALRQNNFNEIVIMADATTKFARNMEDAFDAEIRRADTKESRHELLCVTMAALFTYRFGDVRYGNPLMKKAFEEKEKYDAEYGKDDLAFLQPFFERRAEEIRATAEEKERLRKVSQREEEEKRQQEAAVREQQKARRQMERAAEIRRKKEEQKALQKIRSEAWQAEVEQFKQIPLPEQLLTIVSNDKVPEAYGLDLAVVSETELRTVPRSTLVQVITSFRNVKDSGWKELQKKAGKILSA